MPPQGPDAAARLLLIDRNPASARALTESLSQCFLSATEVAEARGGRQAVEMLRLSPFDIVLVDLTSLEDLSPSTEDAVARLVRLAEGALLIALSDGASVSAAVPNRCWP